MRTHLAFYEIHCTPERPFLMSIPWAEIILSTYTNGRLAIHSPGDSHEPLHFAKCLRLPLAWGVDLFLYIIKP